MLLIIVFKKIVHSYERGDHIGDDTRGGFRSQETSHSSLHNCTKSVDGDGRGGYRSQTIHSLPHDPGGVSIFLCLYVHGNDRGVHRSQTIHLPSHNHVEKCSFHPSFPQDAFPRVCEEKIFKTLIKDVTYIHIKIVLIILVQ